MAMPNELVLIRHGHSEGNLATESSKAGDDSFYTPEFRERPGRQWRLTAEGREQARTAGAWILENIDNDFDRYYVSPYVRTRETAGLLGLPNANWRISQRLRERDWGDISSLPRSEFRDIFPQNALTKQIDALYWRPPNGESIADVRMRVRDFFDTLHRECDGRRVVIVTHGEFMWATRAELEYMTDEQWIQSDSDAAKKIHNTQIIRYTRLNPETGHQASYLEWTQSQCPWMTEVAAEWSPIKRQLFTNKDLMDQVNQVQPVVPLDSTPS
jgi:broad specificity phosphatase PhoE